MLGKRSQQPELSRAFFVFLCNIPIYATTSFALRNLYLNNRKPIRIRRTIADPCRKFVMTPLKTRDPLRIENITGFDVHVR
jgi:hypothetical protein